jgi:hypothetical protein
MTVRFLSKQDGMNGWTIPRFGLVNVSGTPPGKPADKLRRHRADVRATGKHILVPLAPAYSAEIGNASIVVAAKQGNGSPAEIRAPAKKPAVGMTAGFCSQGAASDGKPC